MATDPKADFLAGVVEGFYGPPWSTADRVELFEWMAQWGLNTYLYAPKDDLNHRALWREPYSAVEAQALRNLIQACRGRNLRFIYALSPGLDIRYDDPAEREHLLRRCSQLIELGCHHFGLLFDDVPERPDTAERVRSGALAAAQCRVANPVFNWIRARHPDARFLFCPAPYCGRMAEQGVGGPNYLSQLGRELSPGIDVFWTGPEIISREISVAHVRELQARLRRKPLLWDNLHANDYDGRRFFCGPYAGRPPGLPGEVSGILANPNTEFPLNYVPLRTLADYLRAGADWDPRRAYLEAMRLWWPRFATVGAPIEFEDLVRFGDCYYLPHEEGPEAEALYRQVRHLLAIPVERWGQATTAWLDQASRLRAVCGRLPELRCRPLFHALSRRVWELREELDLLEGFVRRRYQCPTAPCRSDFHLPDTYRGGLVARLQRLLEQRSDGTFIPAAVANADASEPQSISSL